MARKLFSLIGEIMVDSDKADKSLQKTESMASKIGGTLGKGVKAAGKFGLAMGAGAAAAGAAVMGLAKKTAESTDRIDKLSQQLGMSREGFQEWDFILSQNGVSIDDLKSGMKTLTNMTDDLSKGTRSATDAFGQLGIKYEDLEGLSQEEIFEKTVAALQGMEDETKRAAIANDLLGRSGADLAPLLNQSAESVENLKNQAHEMGMVLSDETVDAGVEFTDTMDTLQRTVGGALSSALGPLLPVINDIATEFTKLVPEVMAFIGPLVGELIPVVSKLAEKLIPAFIKILDAVMPVIDPLVDIFMLFVDDVLLPLIDALLPIIEALMPPLISLIEVLVPVLKPVLELFFDLLDLILPPLIKMIGWLSEKWIPILVGALEGIGPAIEKVGEFFTNVFGGIGNFFKGFVNGIIDGINFMIRGLNALSFDIPDWVPVLGGKKFGLDIREIPKLKDGGEITKDGMALVGEAGPELLNLPKAAEVVPLSRTQEISVVNNFNVTDKATADYAANAIVKAMQRRGVGLATR